MASIWVSDACIVCLVQAALEFDTSDIVFCAQWDDVVGLVRASIVVSLCAAESDCQAEDGANADSHFQNAASHGEPSTMNAPAAAVLGTLLDKCLQFAEHLFAGCMESSYSQASSEEYGNSLVCHFSSAAFGHVRDS